MKRTVIKIDEDLCNGCGDCVTGCHEGALQLVNGKAVLVSDIYCDGLGDCIGECPVGAISFEEREADPYDEAAVMERLALRETQPQASQLTHFPVQLHLVNPQAAVFAGADLLLAADCTAFASGEFHSRFLKGKALAIACPKLDHTDAYTAKLVEMIDGAKINTLTVLIMEVPCCSGLLRIARMAQEQARRNVPLKVIVLSVRGELKSEE